MRRLTTQCAATLGIMILLLGGHHDQVVAQAGTPVATAGCRTAPRSLAAIQALFTSASPQATGGTPVPTAAGGGSSPGTPADAEMIAGVTATAQESIACFNTGQVLSFLALCSDSFVRSQVMSAPQIDQATYDTLATPQPVPTANQITLLQVQNIQLLADGRVSAVLESNDPTSRAPQPERPTFIFSNATGRWLIDQVIEDTTSSATPVPAGTPAT
jgi:hypothetical protein